MSVDDGMTARDGTVADDGMIWSYSGVSAFTGEPFVTLRWGSESGQQSPEQARELALSILRAADASEMDALLVKQLGEIGVDEQAALRFLVDLRHARGES